MKLGPQFVGTLLSAVALLASSAVDSDRDDPKIWLGIATIQFVTVVKKMGSWARVPIYATVSVALGVSGAFEGSVAHGIRAGFQIGTALAFGTALAGAWLADE